MPTLNITLLYARSSKQKYPHRADRPRRLKFLCWITSCALPDWALRKGDTLLSKYHTSPILGELGSSGIWEDGRTDLAALGLKRPAEKPIPPNTKPCFLLAGRGLRLRCCCASSRPPMMRFSSMGGMLEVMSTERGLASLLCPLPSSTSCVHPPNKFLCSTSLLPGQHPGSTLQAGWYACTNLKQLPTAPVCWCSPPLGYTYMCPPTCVTQHHFVSYESAVEAQFLYQRLYTAPEMLSVKIKELYHFNKAQD